MDNKYALNRRVRYRNVGGEGVLLHIESGRVLVVNEVGLRIIQMLDEPKTMADLVGAVIEEFDASHEQARDDVEAFLNSLDHEKVLACTV